MTPNLPAAVPQPGLISLGELCQLAELEPQHARLLALRHAGQPVSRMRGGRVQLYWPLASLEQVLLRQGVVGLMPGLWCTRAMADRQLAEWPAPVRRKLLSSRLLRRRTGRSPQGTTCSLYALADLLSCLRRSPDFFTT